MKPMFNRITLVAHRGYSSHAPENTLAAFSMAVAQGYKDIEFDVQLTKDNIPVIMHDTTVDRTTSGKGLVKNYTYAELKKLNAGSWFGESYNDETIPSLVEVLELLKGKAHIHIELKKDLPELPLIVAEKLRSTGWLDDVGINTIKLKTVKPKIIISSEDRMMLLTSIEQYPAGVLHEIIVDEVTDEGLQWASAHGLFSYHPDGNDITPELIKKAKKLNLHVGAWWWTQAEQDVRKIKGAKYAFVDSPHQHRSQFDVRIARKKMILKNHKKSVDDKKSY
jgi:glycerophosphoryl diester phosphodiesterase